MKYSIIKIAICLCLSSLTRRTLSNIPAVAKSSTIIIKDKANMGDSILFLLQENSFVDFSTTFSHNKKIGVRKKGNLFLLHLDCDKATQFNILIPPGDKHERAFSIVQQAIIRPGDSMVITIESPTSSLELGSYSVMFSGKGSAVNNCLWDIRNTTVSTSINDRFMDDNYKYIPGNSSDEIMKLQLLTLKKYSPYLSVQMKAFVRTMIELANLYHKLRNVDVAIRHCSDSICLNKIFDFFKTHFRLSPSLATNQLAVYTDEMINYGIFYFAIDEKLSRYAKASDPNEVYYKIRNGTSGLYRDLLIKNFLNERKRDLINGPQILDDAATIAKNSSTISFIKELGELRVGNKAYDFSLTDLNGKLVKLSDLKGKVVFIDFWFTGCTHCKYYYKNVVSKVEEEYSSDSGVVFITISIDKNFDTWKKSVKTGDYTGSAALNLYTNGSGSDNAVIKKYNVHSYPSPYIIDRNGNLFTENTFELRKLDSLSEKIEECLKIK